LNDAVNSARYSLERSRLDQATAMAARRASGEDSSATMSLMTGTVTATRDSLTVGTWRSRSRTRSYRAVDEREREREYEIRLKPLTPITGLDGLCYEIHKHVTIAAYAALGLLANCSAVHWCSRGTLTARVGRVDQLTRVAQLTRTISAWALWCSTTVTANHFVGAAHHLY
jgi:hypothetical protein